MKKKYRTTLCRKSLAIAMALMVGVTFMPAFGGVYAAEDDVGEIAQNSTEAATPESTPSEDFEVVVDEEENAEPAVQDITASEEIAETSSEVEEDDISESTAAPDMGVLQKKGASSSVPAGAYTVTISGTGNALTIEGNIPSTYTKQPYYYVFGALFIDGVQVKDFTGQTSITKQTVSLSGFGTGYHTAFLQLYNKNTGALQRLIFKEKIPYNAITDKPTYKGSFEVYSKYLNYYPYTITYANAAGLLYMEYSSNGGKSWQRSGYMKRNDIELGLSQGFKISGLKANKKYKTRIRYGSYVTYKKITPSDFGLSLADFQKYFNTTRSYLGDGSTYFFGGPVFYTGTYKTGKAKKPVVKSVTVKAVKKKYHKVKHYGPYTGVYLYTEKFWTCKIKVTVKLKKKPGTKGIWVNGKFLKGNKKKYTTTFSPYPNYFTKRPPKGMKKYTVSIRSYQAKSYGGYSPIYKKKKKIR